MKNTTYTKPFEHLPKSRVIIYKYNMTTIAIETRNFQKNSPTWV